MALYEHIFLARQDLSQPQVEELVEKFKEVITNQGGQVKKVEHWGLRSLSYRIEKNRKAYYVLMNIDTPPAAVFELERQERINESVLRYLTISVDKHNEGPSPLLARKEREQHFPREDEAGHRNQRAALEVAVEEVEEQINV